MLPVRSGHPNMQACCHAADVVLLLFATDRADSLEKVRSRWMPELRRIGVRAPVILVGTKSDLKSTDLDLQQVGMHPNFCDCDGSCAKAAVHGFCCVQTMRCRRIYRGVSAALRIQRVYSKGVWPPSPVRTKLLAVFRLRLWLRPRLKSAPWSLKGLSSNWTGKCTPVSTSSTRQCAGEQAVVEVMSSFKEIETCLECSAKHLVFVAEVFYYAVKAVVHPTAALFDAMTQTLKPRCVNALKRIFMLCDKNQVQFIQLPPACSMFAPRVSNNHGVFAFRCGTSYTRTESTRSINTHSQ